MGTRAEEKRAMIAGSKPALQPNPNGAFRRDPRPAHQEPSQADEARRGPSEAKPPLAGAPATSTADAPGGGGGPPERPFLITFEEEDEEEDKHSWPPGARKVPKRGGAPAASSARGGAAAARPVSSKTAELEMEMERIRARIVQSHRMLARKEGQPAAAAARAKAPAPAHATPPVSAPRVSATAADGPKRRVDGSAVPSAPSRVFHLGSSEKAGDGRPLIPPEGNEWPPRGRGPGAGGSRQDAAQEEAGSAQLDAHGTWQQAAEALGGGPPKGQDPSTGATAAQRGAAQRSTPSRTPTPPPPPAELRTSTPPRGGAHPDGTHSGPGADPTVNGTLHQQGRAPGAQEEPPPPLPGPAQRAAAPVQEPHALVAAAAPSNGAGGDGQFQGSAGRAAGPYIMEAGWPLAPPPHGPTLASPAAFSHPAAARGPAGEQGGAAAIHRQLTGGPAVAPLYAEGFGRSRGPHTFWAAGSAGLHDHGAAAAPHQGLDEQYAGLRSLEVELEQALEEAQAKRRRSELRERQARVVHRQAEDALHAAAVECGSLQRRRDAVAAAARALRTGLDFFPPQPRPLHAPPPPPSNAIPGMGLVSASLPPYLEPQRAGPPLRLQELPSGQDHGPGGGGSPPRLWMQVAAPTDGRDTAARTAIPMLPDAMQQQDSTAQAGRGPLPAAPPLEAGQLGHPSSSTVLGGGQTLLRAADGGPAGRSSLATLLLEPGTGGVHSAQAMGRLSTPSEHEGRSEQVLLSRQQGRADPAAFAELHRNGDGAPPAGLPTVSSHGAPGAASRLGREGAVGGTQGGSLSSRLAGPGETPYEPTDFAHDGSGSVSRDVGRDRMPALPPPGAAPPRLPMGRGDAGALPAGRRAPALEAGPSGQSAGSAELVERRAHLRERLQAELGADLRSKRLHVVAPPPRPLERKGEVAAQLALPEQEGEAKAPVPAGEPSPGHLQGAEAGKQARTEEPVPANGQHDDMMEPPLTEVVAAGDCSDGLQFARSLEGQSELGPEVGSPGGCARTGALRNVKEPPGAADGRAGRELPTSTPPLLGQLWLTPPATAELLCAPGAALPAPASPSTCHVDNRPYRSPLTRFRAYCRSPQFSAATRGLSPSSLTFSRAIDPHRPLCLFEHRGRCNDRECQGQHARQYAAAAAPLLADRKGGMHCASGQPLPNGDGCAAPVPAAGAT